MKKIYKATSGAQFNKRKAQVYGECLESIKDKHGALKADYVLQEAKNKESPLHSYFNWNDKEAARKHRLEQARHLINHLTVVVVYNNKEKEQRAFFSVNRTPEEEIKNKVYVTFEEALTEPQLKKQILLRALNEADYWKDQYRDYNELGKVFKAILETKRKLSYLFKRKR